MFGCGVASRSLLFAKQSSSSKENPTMISNHLLEPLVSSTPKKNITRCLDLFDSDSSFSSDFGTPAKLPRTESPSKCWIDLNDTDTSEQNDLSLKQSWKNRACTNVFDRESKEKVSKGKLRSKMRLKQHSPPFSMFYWWETTVTLNLYLLQPKHMWIIAVYLTQLLLVSLQFHRFAFCSEYQLIQIVLC